MAEQSIDTVPAFSVVIPTRGTRRLTMACLESLHAAGAATEEVELVLVDDAGDDGTAEEAEFRFPAARVLRNGRPRGFTGAANRGLAAARGRHLLLLNSDTEVEPGLWRVLSRAFDKRADLGIAGAALHYPGGEAQWSGGTEPTPLWLFGLASGLAALRSRIPGARRRGVSGASGGTVDWVTGAAMAFRRQVWEQVGPLDERFWLYGQDLDFCCRAREAGWTVAVLGDFRVLHHQGATVHRGLSMGQSQDPIRLWPELVRWAGKRGGPERAQLAATALAAGGHLRLAGHRLRRLVTSGPVATRDGVYHRALEALEAEERTLTTGPEATAPAQPPLPGGD